MEQGVADVRRGDSLHLGETGRAYPKTVHFIWNLRQLRSSPGGEQEEGHSKAQVPQVGL